MRATKKVGAGSSPGLTGSSLPEIAAAGGLALVPPPEPEYLTHREAALLLRVSTKTLCRWAAADPRMPARRIGGVTRYHRLRLLRWIESHGQRIPNHLPSAQPTVASSGDHTQEPGP